MAARAGRRLTGRTRTFWRVLAVSVALMLGGEITWSFYELGLGYEPPTPSWADALYLSSLVVVVPAVLVGFGGVSREQRVRSWVDVVAVAVGVGAAGWHWLISPNLAGGFSVEVASQVAYPLLDLVLVVLLVSRGFAGHRGLPLSIVLVGVAYAVGTAGDVVYSYLTTHDLFETGGWVDLTWQVQFSLVAVAAHRAVRHRDRDAAVARLQRDHGMTVVVVSVALALAVALTQRGADQWTGMTATVVVVVLLVVRWQLTVQDLRSAGVELDRSLAEQSRLSSTDDLTGLLNRRALLARLRELLADPDEQGVGVLVVDLDHFKDVNDRYGHGGGDEVLGDAALRLRHLAEEVGGVAGRWGGEEFVLVVPGATGAEAAEVGEALRSALACRPVPLRSGERVRVTASVGTVATDCGTRDADELLVRADAAMYTAKTSGRDRCVAVLPPHRPSSVVPA